MWAIESTLVELRTASSYYCVAVINGLRIKIFSKRSSTGKIMESKIMPRSIPFEVVLNDYLRNPERAMSYLKSAFEENDPELFQAALQDVISVQKIALFSVPTLPKLVESLQRHGVSEDIILSVVADLSDAVEAA